MKQIIRINREDVEDSPVGKEQLNFRVPSQLVDDFDRVCNKVRVSRTAMLVTLMQLVIDNIVIVE